MDNITLKIDPGSHDLVLADDALVMVSGAETVAQCVRLTLETFKGEWFLDTGHGTDYDQIIGDGTGDPEGVLRAAIFQETSVQYIDAWRYPGRARPALRRFYRAAGRRHRNQPGGECVNENWGLTEAGFLRPSYTELLDALEVKAKELFGSSVNLSVRSPLGIFLRIFAWFAGMLWQLAEQVYNSGFVDTATGISLARLGAFIGIRLLAAQKAARMLQITGEAGASVYAGFLVQARNNQRFVTLEDAVIGEGGTVSVPIQAYEAGPEGNVDAGAIDTVVTPLAAVVSVTNPEATAGGRARETWQEFRERYYNSVDKAGGQQHRRHPGPAPGDRGCGQCRGLGERYR